MGRMTLHAVFAAVSMFAAAGCGISDGNGTKQNNDMENPKMTEEWDKVVPQSDKVKQSKVTFRNRW